MDQSISLGHVGTSEASRSERRDAAANRELILATATRLFAGRSVDGVSMTDIAEAAGVGKGTLYRRFANKGELCLALMDEQLAEFQNTMLEEMRRMAAAETPWLEQLAFFLDGLVFFVEAHVPLLTEVQREGLLPGGQVGLPHIWQYLTISGLLQGAVRAGEVPADLDVPLIADTLLAPLTASFFRFQRQVRGFSAQRISAALRVLVAGLARGRPPGG
jgi:AcrR family transcriptional regulator